MEPLIGSNQTTAFRPRLPQRAAWPWPRMNVAVRAAADVRVLLLSAACVLSVSAAEQLAGLAPNGEGGAFDALLHPQIAQPHFTAATVTGTNMLLLTEQVSWAESLRMAGRLIAICLLVGFFGSAACRCVAHRFAKGHGPAFRELVRFGLCRTLPVTGALLLCPLVFAALSGLRMLFEAVAVIPVVGEYLLPVGQVMGAGLVLIGSGLVLLSAVAWPLMVAGQSVEPMDAFDGLSRAFHFVLSAPARFAVQLLVCLLSFVALASIWGVLQVSASGPFYRAAGLFVSAASTAAFFGWSTVSFLQLRERVDAIEADELHDAPVSTVALEEIPLAGKAAH